MELLNAAVNILVLILCGISALLSILLLTRLQWPAPAWWFLKLFVGALSPVFAAIGLLGFITGLLTGSVPVTLAGIYCSLVYGLYVLRVSGEPAAADHLSRAFSNRPNVTPGKYALPHRFMLKLPTVPEPRWERDIPFAAIPGTGRQLLCDLWQPPADIAPSGLAFIYFHGSAWYLLDKDCGTRPFFRHLAAQGHVVMDVAYRLAPETDMMGMVGDVKRAIAWMKEHAADYNVDPNKIVLGGGSAGGHLALLAAYTSGNEQFTPAELTHHDLEVSAVVSLYGPTDLEATYYHTNQHLTTRNIPGQPQKPVPATMPAWLVKKMGKEYYRLNMDKGFEKAGALASLLGGHPEECPDVYALYSPVTHVHAGCPPALLLYGEHDSIVPVNSARRLRELLTEKNVPSVIHILPQTEHAFDLVMPAIAPAAHTAIYDVERFLNSMAGNKKNISNTKN